MQYLDFVECWRAGALRDRCLSMVDDQREDFGLLYAQLRNTQRVSLKQRSIWVIMSIMLIGFIASAGTIMAYYFLPNQDLLFGERKSAGSMDKLIHVEYEGDEYIIPEPFVRQVDRTVIGRVKRSLLRLVSPRAWLPEVGRSPKVRLPASKLALLAATTVTPKESPV